MLVLLIIMMLIAPLLQKGVNVTLPTADHVVDKPDTQQQTVVHVTANKEFYVNNVPVDAARPGRQHPLRAGREEGEGRLPEGRRRGSRTARS